MFICEHDSLSVDQFFTFSKEQLKLFPHQFLSAHCFNKLTGFGDSLVMNAGVKISISVNMFKYYSSSRYNIKAFVCAFILVTELNDFQSFRYGCFVFFSPLLLNFRLIELRVLLLCFYMF